MKGVYRPKAGIKINYFGRMFVIVGVIMAAIIRGTPVRGIDLHYQIIGGVIFSATLAYFMLSRINYSVIIDGPILNIQNQTFKNDYVNIDVRNFFIHGSVKGKIGEKRLNFIEIGKSGKVHSYDLRVALSEVEFIELINKLEKLKRVKLQDQLNITDKEIIINTSTFKRTNLSVIENSLIIPVIAVLVDMLLKNKMGLQIIPIILFVFTVFIVRGFKGIYDRRKKRIDKIIIDKDEIVIHTPKSIDEYKIRDLENIAISHPVSYGKEEKLLRIVNDGKANFYFYGDQNYTTLDYQRLFAKLTEDKKIGIFY